MEKSQYLLFMRFTGEKYPDLIDVSSMLYDLELTHDYGLILTESEYKNYVFQRFFWFRNGRPTRPYHRLKLARITKESPIEIAIIFSSLPAVWILVQIFEKVRNMPLNRRKLKLEVEKLELEVEKERQERIDQVKARIEERQASDPKAKAIEEQLTDRLNKNPLQLGEIHVEKPTPDSDNSNDKSEKV